MAVISKLKCHVDGEVQLPTMTSGSAAFCGWCLLIGCFNVHVLAEVLSICCGLVQVITAARLFCSPCWCLDGRRITCTCVPLHSHSLIGPTSYVMLLKITLKLKFSNNRFSVVWWLFMWWVVELKVLLDDRLLRPPLWGRSHSVARWWSL